MCLVRSNPAYFSLEFQEKLSSDWQELSALAIPFFKFYIYNIHRSWRIIVERPLRMREVPVSVPGFSTVFFFFSFVKLFT